MDHELAEFRRVENGIDADDPVFSKWTFDGISKLSKEDMVIYDGWEEKVSARIKDRPEYPNARELERIMRQFKLLFDFSCTGFRWPLWTWVKFLRYTILDDEDRFPMFTNLHRRWPKSLEDVLFSLQHCFISFYERHIFMYASNVISGRTIVESEDMDKKISVIKASFFWECFRLALTYKDSISQIKGLFHVLKRYWPNNEKFLKETNGNTTYLSKVINVGTILRDWNKNVISPFFDVISMTGEAISKEHPWAIGVETLPLHDWRRQKMLYHLPYLEMIILNDWDRKDTSALYETCAKACKGFGSGNNETVVVAAYLFHSMYFLKSMVKKFKDPDMHEFHIARYSWTKVFYACGMVYHLIQLFFPYLPMEVKEAINQTTSELNLSIQDVNPRAKKFWDQTPEECINVLMCLDNHP